ncbi:MAG: FAD-binding protein [Pseudomonadales bacterium]|jgi:glycolate oxidase|nr:FAD-binding protein [Pseudomonadales bacterium]
MRNQVPETDVMPGPWRQTLLRRLRAIVGEDSVLAHAEQLAPYECDGLSAHRQSPLVVVLPDTIEQLQSILRLCHELQVPVVARGAGTGLSGGALPLANGVLLGLAKFNRILDIDAHNRSARVQPGVRNLAISQAVEHLGLYYAPDPSSQIACTIGGNVAENAGGVHCLKYGLTVHNILALEVITIEGERLTIGGNSLDTPGYELLALMTGSEGMLGVIVEVTVRLLPKPHSVRLLLAAFDDVERAGDAVTSIIAAGIVPGGLEMMDNPAIRAAEGFVNVGYPVDAAAMLLCELDGSAEEVEVQARQVGELLVAAGSGDIRVARDERERLAFWSGRKAAFPAVGRIAADYYCMDGTIPRARLGEVLRRIGELSRQHDLPVANVFHAGDGNLHPLILYDAGREGQLARAEAFGARILELCVEVGGTITGEHGVGVEKIDQMCVQFRSAELAQFHALKQAFDPPRLLNPGKAVPTLARCAELGGMHVHGGRLPFPELERF